MTIYTDPEENEDYKFVFPPHGHRPPEIRYPRPHHRHRHHHPLVSTPLGMGPRGPKGDTFSFDDLTDEQLAELREDVASVYHRKLESVYTTTGENTSQIPIPWDSFDPEKDMLFVRIEGLWLHANEYTVSDGNIVLTTPIVSAGTAVGITMITTVAMSVEDIEDLRGEDGFSPVVTMVRQNDGTLLSITDSDGTKSALIPDGAIGPTGQTGPVGPAGPQGDKGDKGDKGDVGPVGPKGQKGDKGDKGDAGLQGPKGDTGDQGPQGVTGPVGPQGEDGANGFSPTVSVQTITGGHEVTITDGTGAHSFDVMDGDGSIPYGTVDATSTATAFTATVEGVTRLANGTTVVLHNGVVTSAKNFTININGLGAKKCYSNMTNATQETTIFNVAYTLMFIYSTALDSGNGGWWVYRGYDENTTYTPVKLGFGYGHCTTAAATAAKAVAISGYTLNTGGIVTVLFDNDVQAGAKLNVTSKGAKAIYHKGAAITNGVIKAGDTATFIYSGQYHLISIDRSNIEDGSITTEKLAPMAVTASKIADKSITTTKLASKAVDSYNLADGAVTWAKLIDSVVDTKKLANLAVTEDKLDSSAVTTTKLADGAVAFDKIDPNVISRIQAASLIAADSQASQALTALKMEHRTLTPEEMAENYEYANSTNRLCWIKGTFIEVAAITFFGDLQSGQITLCANGMHSTASGKLGIDTSWTITALPTDADGVSY